MKNKFISLALACCMPWAAQAAEPNTTRTVLPECERGACLSFAPELELPSAPVSVRPFANPTALRAHKDSAEAAPLASPPPPAGTVVLSSGQGVLVAPAVAPGTSMPASDETLIWAVRKSDGTVRRMLHRWASNAGWQLTWDAQRDFPVETDFQIHGTFREAVGLVMESLATSDFPVQATLNSHLKLLRIGKYLQGSAQ